MAKGLRSKVKKSNKTCLRQKIFGPVEHARKERLSAKLLELATRPQSNVYQDDKSGEERQEASNKKRATLEVNLSSHNEGAMDLDTTKKAIANSKSTLTRSTRIRKKGRRKPQNSLVFKNFKKERLKQGRKKR